MHIGERHIDEPGPTQDAFDHRWLAEGERIQADRGRLARADRLTHSHRPFVAFLLLPDEQYEPGIRAQRPSDIRERRHQVTEEHHSEPTDADVELAGRERMGLRVRLLVGDIRQTFVSADPAGQGERVPRDVDAEHAAVRRDPGRLAGRLTGSAADIEHPVVAIDGCDGAESLVVRAYLRVEEVGPGDPQIAHGWIVSSRSRLCTVINSRASSLPFGGQLPAAERLCDQPPDGHAHAF